MSVLDLDYHRAQRNNKEKLHRLLTIFNVWCPNHNIEKEKQQSQKHGNK